MSECASHLDYKCRISLNSKYPGKLILLISSNGETTGRFQNLCTNFDHILGKKEAKLFKGGY